MVKKQKKQMSSHFQYSERTKATTETNNTSKESSEHQLLGARKTIVWHYQGAPRLFAVKSICIYFFCNIEDG